MALTPEELKAIPEDFINLYQDLEDFIIADIARRISKVGKLTDSAKLETIRANEIGISLKLVKEKVKELLKFTDEKMNQIFNDAGLYSVAQENILYSAAGLNTVKITNNSALANIISAAIKQTSGELYNLTQSMGFAQRVNGKIVYKPIAKYYQDAMDLAVMQIKSGATDYNTAIKQAVDRLSESGIRHVDYDSGVVNKIDVAVRRAVMTGANQMTQKITLEGMEETGNDFVETTAHVGARPGHALWQGRVFCYSGKSKEYPPFIESTGYGTGPGLGGWNCRHSFYPFVPGISKRAYTDEQLENIDPPPFKYNGKTYTYYEATQHQRYVERKIRKTKSQLVGYKAAGLDEEFTNASIRLKQQEKYYKEFSSAADIPMEKPRLQMHKFDRSLSQKAVWAKKKHDQQEFNKFKTGLGSLAPKTLEEFKDIMYNKPIELKALNEKLDLINSYQIDYGHLTPEKILELDSLGFDAKRNKQISKFKKQGNFAVLQYNGNTKFASSRIAYETDKEYIKFKGNKEDLVLLKDEGRVFKTSDLGDIVDGEENQVPRHFDTEAKFFEYLNDVVKHEKVDEIFMLSEKKMCESCRNVAKQFIKKHPNIKVNVVSSKTFDGWKGR